MILCWNEGQSSTIHVMNTKQKKVKSILDNNASYNYSIFSSNKDHAESHCFLKVLKGSLNEVKYKFPIEENNSEGNPDSEQNELEEISRSTVHENDVCYINGKLTN